MQEHACLYCWTVVGFLFTGLPPAAARHVAASGSKAPHSKGPSAVATKSNGQQRSKPAADRVQPTQRQASKQRSSKPAASPAQADKQRAEAKPTQHLDYQAGPSKDAAPANNVVACDVARVANSQNAVSLEEAQRRLTAAQYGARYVTMPPSLAAAEAAAATAAAAAARQL